MKKPSQHSKLNIWIGRDDYRSELTPSDNLASAYRIAIPKPDKPAKKKF